MNKLRNIHPGEILMEEFLRPMEISQTRLAKVFGTSVQFWMGLQDDFELREARAEIEDQLKEMVPIAA